ncbi:uncharacterized protein FA14DRAFT_184310 [Meira miltonrushii]|uniref:ALMS motif domain-containing protein n=1 Tax=Meira miltonrushii TaxID=1280837 RepID=A0A316VF52_9BASI|nr:uncharacterized protein FA14DRAFT_184310 [Meira miltonrushii]PWN34943.1 hypothetical protein FA14DRAFT_184310 [Meira miltonrushii]
MLLKLHFRILFYLYSILSEVCVFHVDAVKASKRGDDSKNLQVQASKNPELSEKGKQTIPDLNFPPPPEEEQPEDSRSTDPQSKRSTYALRMERYKANGTLEAYRAAQKHRQMVWYNNLTEEEKRARSRRDAETRKAKNAQLIKTPFATLLISTISLKPVLIDSKSAYSKFTIAVKGQKKAQRATVQNQLPEQLSNQFKNAKKENIPDLNFPPPLEETVLQTVKGRREPIRKLGNNSGKKKSMHAIKVEKLKEEGSLQEFLDSEASRVRAYRESLGPEKRKEQSRRSRNLLAEKFRKELQLHADIEHERKQKSKVCQKTQRMHYDNEKQIRLCAYIICTNAIPMTGFWTLIFFLLSAFYAFTEISKCATSKEGTNLVSNSPSESGEQIKPDIPDLNIPLVEEPSIDETTSHNNPGSSTTISKASTKSKHASKVSSRIRKGTLAEFREKERERVRRYRANLSEEAKKAHGKKVVQRRMKLMKDNPALRESYRKASQESYRRNRGRTKAEKEGRSIEPEHAKRKHGRKIKPLPPNN